jgi:3-hydroxyisobutyrate dehydrogenase
MAARLIQAGHQVSVWNRSPAAAEPLAKAGASVASSPRDAATNADFVIAMVRDDEASRQVWLAPETGALVGMRNGAIAIESSTVSREWISELGKAAQSSSISLLEAPVSGSRPQAEAGQLIYFVGGDEDTAKQAEPVLRTLGTELYYVGSLGTGAMTKLATNALLGIQVTAMAELLGILKCSGADTGRVLQAIAGTVVCSVFAKRVADGMLAEDFAPQFPVELVAKDFGYVLAAAGAPELAPTIAAAYQVFTDAQRRGMGPEHLTCVVKLFGECSPLPTYPSTPPARHQ